MAATSRYSYSKQELFTIKQLPASNVKPPDLDPIVDKENKELFLLFSAVIFNDFQSIRIGSQSGPWMVFGPGFGALDPYRGQP